MKNAWISLAVVCALVIGVYAYTAHSGFLTSSSLNAADDYYNLLVQGFRDGQLNLKTDVPLWLAQLADPYEPAAHSHYGVLDMSYYNGKLYLYFGVTPAVVLFWPYVALTGHYLLQKNAAVIFCVAGFLVSTGLLWALWRRYFATVSVTVVAAGTLALGLATFTPFLLAGCEANQVAISCGYALTMLALAAIWKTLHEPERRCRWLAAASLAYGLAVGARPSLLFGAVILLAPVAQAWRERRAVLALWLAAAGPMVLIGLGLMIYNALRFGSPFEFGGRYQLTGVRLLAQQFFSLRYLWFNFRVYFLEPARWSGQFPFVHDITLPPVPVGNIGVDKPFGVLTNIPLVWLALAVPLAWRSRSAEARSRLCEFLTVVFLLFGICALTLVLFCAVASRHELDFLPALVLLAVIGILSLERTLAPTSESGLVGQPLRRGAMRCGWGFLLGFSVAFNLLACIGQCAEPHCNLGNVLLRQGRVAEAIAHYEQALQLNPDYTEAHNNLGSALVSLGRVPEAIEHYEQALRIDPENAEAHYNLGRAFFQEGNLSKAIEYNERALRIRPNYAEAHNNLGAALVRLGRVPEAIGHYEQALRLQPDFAQAHNNLGNALLQLGKVPEAIGHYEQALRLQPDFADAYNNLAWLLATHAPAQGGDAVRAVDLAQRACELTGNRRAGYLDTLAAAYAAAGRFSDAVATIQKAIELARATGRPKLIGEFEARLEQYRSGRAYFQAAGDDKSKQPLM